MGVAVSVVVVSDYEEDASSLWATARQILGALGRQDFPEPFEVLLVESERFRDTEPPDLATLCPHLTVVYSSERQSAKLKDIATSRATAELVAVFEADCLPEPSWLRVVAAVLRRRPEVSVVSGRTHYGDETMYRRALSLVDRSFDDLGAAGFTPHISNNAALYRRSVLARFPYPETATPFSSSILRMQAMARAGDVRLFFEPAAVVRHAIGGWNFVRDFRRHLGYADMSCHPVPRLRRIPGLLGQRTSREWRDCLRLGRRYLRWYDWPLTALLLAAAPVLQIPGMLDAWRQRDRIPGTSYR